MTVPRRSVCYRGRQIQYEGGHRQEERVMEDLGTDEDGGVDISITDEVQSDMDTIAGTDKPKGYVEQDNL